MKRRYARNVIYKIDKEHQSLSTGESCSVMYLSLETNENRRTKGQLIINILVIEHEAAVFS